MWRSLLRLNPIYDEDGYEIPLYDEPPSRFVWLWDRVYYPLTILLLLTAVILTATR